jgi:Domain of unknown function (DUF4129)
MRSRRFAPVLAVVAVALVALVAAVAGPVRVGEPVISFEPFAILAEPCDDEQGGDAEGLRGVFQNCDEDEDDPLAEWWDEASPPGLLSVGALLAAVLVALAALILLGWLLRTLVAYLSRLRLPPLPERRPADDVSVEVVHALREAADLAVYEAESAPPGRAGDAVVACWVLLEDAAARVGTPRAAPQTPTEFTAALLTEYQPDRNAVETLLRLYHRARFGSEPLPDESARVAGDALRRIAAGLYAVSGRSHGVG